MPDTFQSLTITASPFGYFADLAVQANDEPYVFVADALAALPQALRDMESAHFDHEEDEEYAQIWEQLGL